MSRIEEIKNRISILPDEMGWLEINVPKMVKDPSGKMIPDPHQRVVQRRMDIVDKNDFYKRPIIHFHIYPDHPNYEPNFVAIGEAFINLKPDMQFLIEQLKGKQNGE